MKAVLAHARLYINSLYVGDIHVEGWEGGWGIGRFVPNGQFSTFAVLFGTWSLLMHADDDATGVSPAAAQELRRIEQEIDALHVRIFIVEQQEWREVVQLNIDGPLIEWKEIWHAPMETAHAAK